MNRIKQLRIKQGITQEELGKLIGVQSSAISNKNTIFVYNEKLCRVLQTS